MKRIHLILRALGMLILVLTTIQTQAFAQSVQVTIPVDFIVFTPHNSPRLNAKWLNAKFVQKNLNVAKGHLFGQVHFKLGSIRRYKSWDLYQSATQQDALDMAVSQRSEARITVAISGPETQDAVGLAYNGRTIEPAFAMRSRYNGTDSYSDYAKANNAYVFLHELAHNMGLGHCSPGQTSLCTDNVWASPEHAQVMTDYLRTVLNYPAQRESYENRRGRDD